MILSPSKEVRKKEVYDKKRRKENIKKFELVLSLGMMAPYILCITDSPLLALFALALFAVHHTSVDADGLVRRVVCGMGFIIQYHRDMK